MPCFSDDAPLAAYPFCGLFKSLIEPEAPLELLPVEQALSPSQLTTLVNSLLRAAAAKAFIPIGLLRL
jgi:hypothetical protein